MAYDFSCGKSERIDEITNGLTKRIALCGSLIGNNPALELKEEDFINLLARGGLLLGASGTGKTNVYHIWIHYQLSKKHSKDLLFIDDSKGDYLEEHSKNVSPEQLYVITSEEDGSTWNIFGEIMSRDAQGNFVYTKKTDTESLEMSKYFYEENQSESQPIFTKMSRQIFTAMVIYYIRSHIDYDQQKLNNYDFISFFKTLTTEKIFHILNGDEMESVRELLEKTYMDDYHSMINYISGGKSGNQTQGVMSCLNTIIYEVFIGSFAKADPKNEFSIRGLVESSKGAVIFLEYDLQMAAALSPIYAFLVDQLLKYTLGGRNKERKNCYLLIDEWARFKTKLKYMEDGLSMGRSQGLKIACGLQNIKSIESIYGEAETKSILAGFQTVIGFYVTDMDSRTFLSERSGKNYQNISYVSHKKNENSQRDGYCLEDWDIQRLKCGQAAIMMPGENPFYFTFPKYEDWKRERQNV